MNIKFKNCDSVVPTKILQVIQLMVLMLFLLSNSLLAASSYFQSSVVLTNASVSENPLEQQGKRVTGKVTDPTGMPIPGASVVVKGTTTGTTTDSGGNFNFLIPNDAKVLTFTFVGMKSQEEEIGTKTTFNVTLSEESIGVKYPPHQPHPRPVDFCL